MPCPAVTPLPRLVNGQSTATPLPVPSTLLPDRHALTPSRPRRRRAEVPPNGKAISPQLRAKCDRVIAKNRA